jgi:hypothetical protein
MFEGDYCPNCDAYTKQLEATITALQADKEELLGGMERMEAERDRLRESELLFVK